MESKPQSNVMRDIEALVGQVSEQAEIVLKADNITSEAHGEVGLSEQVAERLNSIARGAIETIVENEKAAYAAVARLASWMREGTMVRVLGAGRARLAAAIPANRLAHGGAHVFVQDTMIPMPHSVRGGGILAASASGSTSSVLEAMTAARRAAPNIEIVGIADRGAEEFASLCHIFIGIHAPVRPPLSALADISEYILSEVLDALVVAAGQECGYDDRAWRLGHENLGATGPYDSRALAPDFYFTS